MARAVIIRRVVLALCVARVVAAASGQATSDSLAIKAIAEVETIAKQDGREVVRLAPADRVVPGDQVIYTLEIRNVGAIAVHHPTVMYSVPSHMAYVADSATGPGAEVSYSVDGGHRFDRPENLRMIGSDGHSRLAIDKDYTHIRWELKNSLKSNSVAFARFHAVVK